MKKISLVSTILLVMLVLVVVPSVNSTIEITMPFDTMIFREEFAYGLDEEAIIAQQSLPEDTPFWVDLVDAEGLQNDGEGVYVAVLDTGLLDFSAFYGFPMSYWFFSEANIAWSLGKGFSHDIYWDDGIGDIVVGPLDDTRGFWTKDYEGSGHGSHVTSTIVGYNYNGLWIKGVAPKATIIPVLVLDAWAVPSPYGTLQFTGGTDEMVSAGIYYIADLAETLDGPVIISMSLGGPDPSQMIEDAINYAINEGVIVVASAGNEGYDGMGWPGAYPQVISCAMAGWTEGWIGYPNRWWTYDVSEKLNSKDYYGNNWQIYLDYSSSRPNIALGQMPQDLDVSAPGCAIVGPYSPYFSLNLGYYYLWGTSMAAPHVSGMAALVLESYPDMTQAQMESTLKTAAAKLPLPSDGAFCIDVPGYYWYFTWFGIDWGSGFLQADNALGVANIFNLGRFRNPASPT